MSSYADVRGEHEAMEALLTSESMDIYDHALFAGNSSKDALYKLKLGGSGVQADAATSQRRLRRGDRHGAVGGTIRAEDDITEPPGETGVFQPTRPAVMDYPNTADFKVADLFHGGGTSPTRWAAAPTSCRRRARPIFRENPSDRATDINATVKNDYFLEDPYEPVHADSGSTGKDCCPITLSGLGGKPGVNGNHKVYYIDGNLWIHNKNVFSFQIQHNEPNGIQVTFVVKGNIYFSDNVFYKNTQEDGIAFIAMKDSKVTDSGNIYFGDPVFGTLEQMHAFMYAENNFIDKNLSATGSATVSVFGNMTAGNKVDIQRDYGKQHSKLTVNYDGRISHGDLKMPGIPHTDEDGGKGWQFKAVRRIAHP